MLAGTTRVDASGAAAEGLDVADAMGVETRAGACRRLAPLSPKLAGVIAAARPGVDLALIVSEGGASLHELARVSPVRVTSKRRDVRKALGRRRK